VIPSSVYTDGMAMFATEIHRSMIHHFNVERGDLLDQSC
jgi:hypothetical protein